MKTYRVRWEIDVEAVNPQHAARKALAIQRDKDSTAAVFDVREQGKRKKTVRVDLLEPKEVQP